MLLLLVLPGQLAMRAPDIAAGPASRKEDASPPRRRKSKGTMPPHRRQHGGALGGPDAHGEIRWMLEQYLALDLATGAKSTRDRSCIQPWLEGLRVTGLAFCAEVSLASAFGSVE
jgi:hypothetical protein